MSEYGNIHLFGLGEEELGREWLLADYARFRQDNPHLALPDEPQVVDRLDRHCDTCSCKPKVLKMGWYVSETGSQ